MAPTPGWVKATDRPDVLPQKSVARTRCPHYGLVMSDTKTVTWKVDGMTCGGCSGSVERVLAGASGLTSAKASHKRNEVVLTFQGVLDDDEIQRRIESAGFDVAERG